MPELNLYYRNTCSYCHKVRKFSEENGIQLNYKNITNDQKSYQELLDIGGKIQVPCLFIDGQPMYESDDIIVWLTDNAI